MKSSSLITPERVQWQKRSRFNPINGLTPERLSMQLDQFRVGIFNGVAQTWDVIEERDDILMSVIPKRKKAVARNGWEILMVDVPEGRKAEAQRHRTTLERIWNNISVTAALDEDERGGVRLLAKQMMDCVGKKYAVHEIVWKPGVELSAEFRFVPLWFFEGKTSRLRFLKSDFAQDGEVMPEGDWLVTVGDGLMAASSICWMYKHLPLQDWVFYCERFGFPAILGKTTGAPGSPEWEAMTQAVKLFGNDFAAVMNKDETIELLSVGAQGTLPHPLLIERMDRALATLWRGADLSTISAGDGQGTGASVQGDETDLLEQDDAQLISETLNAKVEPFVISYYFGEGVTPLAYIKLSTKQKDTVERDIKIDSFLRDSGVPISVDSTLERLSRTPAKPGEAVLQRPPSTAFTGTTLPNEAPAATAQQAEQVTQQLLANADALLAQALVEDRKPVLERIAAINAITDPQLQKAAAQKLRDDLPEMLSLINQDLKAAQVTEDTQAAAYFNGAAAAIPTQKL